MLNISSKLSEWSQYNCDNFLGQYISYIILKYTSVKIKHYHNIMKEINESFLPPFHSKSISVVIESSKLRKILKNAGFAYFLLLK